MKGLSLLKMASIALVFCAAAAIASAQTLTTLYSFCAQTNCTDGSTPYAGLVQGTDGNLYGATELGGTVNTDYCLFGCGTVFQITLSGTLTTLYSFDETDGAFPYAGLLQGTDGDLYGTTEGGGPVGTDCNFGCGTVFKITTRGILTTLYTMNFHIGYFPYAGLVQVAGDFYGTAYGGGYFPTSD